MVCVYLVYLLDIVEGETAPSCTTSRKLVIFLHTCSAVGTLGDALFVLMAAIGTDGQYKLLLIIGQGY